MKRVKVSIDLGNSMLKAVTYVNGKAVKAKLPNRTQVSKTISPKARKMDIDGKVLYLGVGDLNNNILKHTRHNLLDQVLVMVHELYPNESKLGVELSTGLPPAQLFNDKYLEEFQNLFTEKGTIKFSVNGMDKEVEITSVEVYAEGYSGFVSIVEDLKTKQDILSIDVGGGTTDTCNYQYDYEDEMYYPDVTETIETGVIDFAEEIASKFNNTHGADIKAIQIDHILKNDLDIIEYEGKEYKLEEYVDAIESTVNTMINKITNKYGTLSKYAVVGIGGGYKTFERIAKEQISKSIELDAETQFYANALGYLEQ
ncbi:MAG: hypothetical protein ACRDD7_03425 [Peptostreptococcaceae bacterium]